MKKALLISIILLSILCLPLVPVAKSGTNPALMYNITCTQAKFEECADFTNTNPPNGTYIPWDVDIVNAEKFPNGGQGIYIAVLDTGLVSNWAQFVAPTATIRTDLGRGWSYNVTWDPAIDDFDFTPNPNRGFITKDYEGSGHGTHVTCEIVGYQRRTVGVAPHIVEGVAPKATIIPILGLDDWLVDCPDPNYPGCHAGKVLFRGGDDWMLTSAIYYIASLAETNHWKIIVNNSWGSSEPDPAIRQAVDYAIGKGVIFVFAAGNAGSSQMDWPGAYPEVISAAAGGWTMQMVGYPPSNPPSPYRWYLTDVPECLNTPNDPLGVAGVAPPGMYVNSQQMFLTTFSGRPNATLGQYWWDLDVCAPGSYVVGPYKPEAAWSGTAWVNLNAPTAYYGLWGTSMATPHVSGIAAIVAQQCPRINQFEMEFVLKSACWPMYSGTMYANDPFYGPAFPKTDHEAGNGWLLADWAVWEAWLFFGRFGAGRPGFCR